MEIKKNMNVRLLEDVNAIPIKYKNSSSSVQQKKIEKVFKYEIVTVLGIFKDYYIVTNILGDQYLIPKTSLLKIIGKSKNKTPIKAEANLPVVDNQMYKAAQIRATQKMQVIASNIVNIDNPVDMGKCLAAAIAANMAITNGLDRMYSNKLLAMTTRLLGSIK